MFWLHCVQIKNFGFDPAHPSSMHSMYVFESYTHGVRKLQLVVRFHQRFGLKIFLFSSSAIFCVLISFILIEAKQNKTSFSLCSCCCFVCLFFPSTSRSGILNHRTKGQHENKHPKGNFKESQQEKYSNSRNCDFRRFDRKLRRLLTRWRRKNQRKQGKQKCLLQVRHYRLAPHQFNDLTPFATPAEKCLNYAAGQLDKKFQLNNKWVSSIQKHQK